MSPLERFGRVEESERLRGVWLRPNPTESRWCAPLRLADGALGVPSRTRSGWGPPLGLCVVELSWAPEEPAARRVFWAVLAREGQLLHGSFDAPGAPSRHALAASSRATALAQQKRLLAEAGIALWDA